MGVFGGCAGVVGLVSLSIGRNIGKLVKHTNRFNSTEITRLR